MVTLSDGDVLAISGNATTNPLNELQAVGGEPGETDPKRHFVVGAGAMLTLKHLQLTGGRVKTTTLHSSDRHGWGGSIFVGANYNDPISVLILQSVRFSGCSGATPANGGACAAHGGAIFAVFESDVTVKDSTFEGTMASHSGGAMYVHAFPIVKLQSCAFKQNTAGQLGGAIFITHQTSTGETPVKLLGGNNVIIQN
jgi:predicted outer membrane repeat protein